MKLKCSAILALACCMPAAIFGQTVTTPSQQSRPHPPVTGNTTAGNTPFPSTDVVPQSTVPLTRPVYYDTFSTKWLDPTKWDVNYAPPCERTLECVREIQNGQLRLVLRNFGVNSDSGDQWSWTGLTFINPNTVYSITADLTVRSFSGMSCPSNGAVTTHADAEFGGLYFNTGSGDASDDVSDVVASVVDTNDPKTVHVSNFMSWRDLGVGADMGSYPMGTTLTITTTWDKAHHQFISVVNVKDDPSKGMRVVVPYSSYFVADTMPPVNPVRWLVTGADTANCTSTHTYAQEEVFYDNLIVNATPKSWE